MRKERAAVDVGGGGLSRNWGAGPTCACSPSTVSDGAPSGVSMGGPGPTSTQQA